MTKVVEGERKDKLKHVKIVDIIFEKRAREDYGDLEELKVSITEKGVLQPITISSTGKLLAGGRRFTACRELGFTTIPAIVRDVVDDVDELEIELIENIHRKDFTWQERALLTARIDSLQRKKNPNWSQAKTGDLVGLSMGMTNKDIQLAKAMLLIPEIAECKTADDAFKSIKKFEEKLLVTELRNRQKEKIETKTPEESGVDGGVRAALKRADSDYRIGNVFDGLAKLRDGGNITIIECDPPYGIDLNNQKGSRDQPNSTATGYKEVPEDYYETFLARLTKELYRVAGKDCWLVFWFGPTWQSEVLKQLQEAGWIVDEIPALWVKPNGQTLQPEKYYARCYEPFYLCRKGNPVLATRGRANVFNFTGEGSKYHPTQRPVELIEEILKTLSIGMDHVLVPFLGSGATLRACYNMGISAFGYDLDDKYKDKFMLAVEEDTRKLFSYKD